MTNREDRNGAGPKSGEKPGDARPFEPSERTPPNSTGRRVVFALLALLAFAGAFALWRVAAQRPAPVADAPAPAEDASRLVQRRLAEAKDYAPFFEILASRFPAESAQIKTALAERLTTDKDAGADALLAQALKSLRETRGVVAAKADAPAMTRVFEAQGAMIAALRAADPKLCVDFVYGGATDAFMTFVATRRPLFAALAKANLDAILDGADKKIERDAPTDDDFAALEKALRDKGLGDAEVATLLDGKTPDPPLPDERMCESAAAYVAAVLALPEPARSRLLALAIELMARG